MKKLILFFVLFSAYMSLFGQTITFSLPAPEQGKSLKFIYDPKGGNLANFSAITCTAKALSSRDYRESVPISLTKRGTVYEGEILPRDSTHLLVFIFSASGNTDENSKGYFTKIYKNGQATPMSIFLEGHLYSGFGNGLAKIETNHQKACELYGKAFDADPALKNSYLNNYLLSKLQINKVEGEKAVYQTITHYNNLEPSERNDQKILALYHMLKNSLAVDSMQQLIGKRYPKGAYALAQAIKDLRNFKELKAKEERFNQLLNEFNLSLLRKEDRTKLNWAFLELGEAYAKTANNDKTEFYMDFYEPKLTRAIFFNNFVKRNIANQSNLEFSAKLSKKSIDIIEELKSETRPAYYESTDQYLAYLAGFQSPNRMSYVRVLTLLGKYAEALAVAETEIKNNFEDAEMAELYISTLAKNGKNDEVFKFAKQFILAGRGSKSIKEELRYAYTGKIPFDVFFEGLEKEAKSLQRGKFEKEMINIPAPKFSLLNLKGEKVVLANLKGKVVVIDYWATWCGPCIRSFPGMQLAVDKYKNDPNVVFLFINTWQQERDREKNVKNWMAANTNYTFNVLLDRRSEDGTENFEVVDQYKVSAIPTKFIVDGNGNIRFRRVGSESTAEAIVSELDMMISLAKDVHKAGGK